MKKWILTANTADYGFYAEKLNIDRVAVKCMMNRNIDTVEKMTEFLSGNIDSSFSYEGLPEIERAVEIIKDAAEKKLKCRVIGDYDADGVCSTTVLVKGLRLFGLDTDYSIPNRITDGYGINESIVKLAYDEGVRLIVTCDNGISAKNAIKFAKDLEMKVVVTDHHTVNPEAFPDSADAVVNPRMSENKYGFSDICGTQVAYKLLCALYKDDTSFEQIRYELLEFAAIASVTDVMPMIKENRSLVKWALNRLTHPVNKGLYEIVKQTNVSEKESATYYDIGFQIGPCINATGRIDVADRAVELFLCEDEKTIHDITENLLMINEERKSLTDIYVKKGEDCIDKMIAENTLTDKIIVLYLPDCHVSLCGLVAGRIREKYYRPTLVFANSEAGLTGSGRSTEEYDIIDGISKCSDILIKFGGHKAACGASLQKENLDELRRRLNADAGLSDDDMIQKIRIDADMPFGYVTEKVINDLSLLEPFGTGNLTPVFAVRNLKTVSARRFGELRNHLILQVKDDSGEIRRLKYWKKADDFDSEFEKSFGKDELDKLYDGFVPSGEEKTITVSYYPGINVYKGNKNIEFIMKDYRL